MLAAESFLILYENTVATSPAINGAFDPGPRPAVAPASLEDRVSLFVAGRLNRNPRRLQLDLRLREDLDLHDDEAIEFFEEFSRQFHVDVDALFSRYWARHFGVYGLSWGSLVLMFLTAASAGFLAGYGAPREAWLLWASLSLLELVVLQGMPFLSPELNLIPIRISDLVHAARHGFWSEPGILQSRHRSRRRERGTGGSAPAPVLLPPSKSA